MLDFAGRASILLQAQSFAWTFAPGVRRVAAATHIVALVALRVWQLGGLFFPLSYAESLLSAPIVASGGRARMNAVQDMKAWLISVQ